MQDRGSMDDINEPYLLQIHFAVENITLLSKFRRNYTFLSFDMCSQKRRVRKTIPYVP